MGACDGFFKACCIGGQLGGLSAVASSQDIVCSHAVEIAQGEQMMNGQLSLETATKKTESQEGNVLLMRFVILLLKPSSNLYLFLVRSLLKNSWLPVLL